MKEVAESLPHAVEKVSMPKLMSTEILPQYRGRAVAVASDNPTHAPAKKHQNAMTHEGIISECYRPRLSRLRETKTIWISESGRRFIKITGAEVGSGIWSSHRLNLTSIRKIQPEDYRPAGSPPAGSGRTDSSDCGVFFAFTRDPSSGQSCGRLCTRCASLRASS